MLRRLIDGLVADEPATACRSCETDMLMSDADGRRRVAAETLRFAEGSSLMPRIGTPEPQTPRRTFAILPVKRFGIAKVRLGDELSAARAARSPRRWSPTSSWRCGARRPSTRCWS